MKLADAKIATIRTELFGPRGEGYFIVKNFLDKNEVSHLRSTWTQTGIESHFAPHLHKDYHIKSKNAVSLLGNNGENKSFFNFYWNHPFDHTTHTIAKRVHRLRNKVEDRNEEAEFTLENGFCGHYRIVISRNGTQIVPRHRDWVHENMCDPFRLQATLILSKKGKDYSGRGFCFTNNKNKMCEVDKDIKVQPGDLILWKFQNEHEVADIITKKENIGFMRMIFPIEPTRKHPKVSLHHAKRYIEDKIARMTLTQKVLKPALMRLRGR